MEYHSNVSASELLDQILETAVRENASDVHIEPGRKDLCIRFRIQGLLRIRFHLPSGLSSSLAIRCKVMGRMDISEKRIPQDGSCTVSLEGQDCELRMSTLPVLYGESIAVRILRSHVPFIEKQELGLTLRQRQIILRRLRQKSGLILITGPTGSGKSSTLYTFLRILRSEQSRIITLEDPVEYKIDGISQVPVNEKGGFTFSSCLRAIVRQDPDIIMIGEIRDRETAELAVQASLTGHLVLSTLHTGTAAQTPLRLLDLGVPDYLLAPALSLIISQRLIRVLCSRCRTSCLSPFWESEKKRLYPDGADRCLFQPGKYEQCELCAHQGYTGRTGIFEVLEITERIKTQLRSHASEQELLHAMKEQEEMPLYQTAVKKMEQGIISMEDALPLISSSAEEAAL